MKGSLSFSIDRENIWVYCGAVGRRGDRGHYIVRSPYPKDALAKPVERIDSGYSMGAERFDIDLPDDAPEDLTGCRITFHIGVRAGPRVASAPVRITLEIRGKPHVIDKKVPLQVRGDQARIRPSTAVVGGVFQAHNVNPDTGTVGYAPPYVPVFPVISGE